MRDTKEGQHIHFVQKLFLNVTNTSSKLKVLGGKSLTKVWEDTNIGLYRDMYYQKTTFKL